MNVNILLTMLILFVLLYSNTRSDSLETVAKSGKWVVVSVKGRNGKNKKTDMKLMEKNINKINEILDYDNGYGKKRRGEKQNDSLLFIAPISGTTYEYRTKDSGIFRFKGDELSFFIKRASKHRHQTREEVQHFKKYGKLPESWATVSVDSAKNIVTTFLQETLKVDDFELFDSLNVRHISYGYLFSYSVRLGDFCGIRRHSVRINANTGEIRSYSSTNEHYSDFEPGYVPKISRDEALRILKSDSRFVGVNVDFRKNEPKIDKELDFEIAKVCLIPITMQHIQVSGKDGWVWRALLRIPDTTGILFDILIDSDTGDILYFDPGLGPRN